MNTTATNFTEEFVKLNFGKVHMMKSGTGKPLLLFQDDLGSPGWLPLYEDLARSFSVYVPSHPGFGKSERPDWMRSTRDLALSHLWLMKTLGLESVSVVGIGFGGWVAAAGGWVAAVVVSPSSPPHAARISKNMPNKIGIPNFRSVFIELLLSA